MKSKKNYEGYYTKSGRCVYSHLQYDRITFQAKTADWPSFFLVMNNGLYGICDLYGNQVMECISYSWPKFSEDGVKIKKHKKGDYEVINITYPGLDLKEATVLEVKEEKDGYSWTKLMNGESKCGVLNFEGNYILPMLYKDIEYLCIDTEEGDGLFEVTTFTGTKGFYDKNGVEYVSELEGYYNILPLNGSYFIVENKEGEKGIYDIFLGELIAPGEYDAINWNETDQIFNIEKNGRHGALDCLGRVLVEPTCPNKLEKDTKGLRYKDNNEYINVYDDIYLSGADVVEAKFNEALKIQEYYKASKAYEAVIELDPVGKYGYLGASFNNLGILRCNEGNFYYGKSAFEDALKVDPENEDYKKNLEMAKNNYEANKVSGWKIVADLLNVVADGAQQYSNIKSNHNINKPVSISANKNTSKTITRKKSNPNAFAHSINENTAKDTYNKYVGQLQEMKTFWETKYNKNQRIQIQTNMRKIREEWGFPKSEWEDWDGTL